MMQMKQLRHRDKVTCANSHGSLSRDLVFDIGLFDAGAHVFHYTTNLKKEKTLKSRLTLYSLNKELRMNCKGNRDLSICSCPLSISSEV